MAVKYKIWIQIERVNEEKGTYENVSEPENIKTCGSKKQATVIMNRIINEYYEDGL